MKRDPLIQKLQHAWNAFNASYSGLTDEQMAEAGVTESWSVKDILAHVNTWEEECLKVTPLILRGGRPPRYSVTYGGIDAFNARMTQEKSRLSIAEIRKRLTETHDKLMDTVKTVPEDQITTDTRFRRRLRLDTYSHYPIHTAAILEWRARKGY